MSKYKVGDEVVLIFADKADKRKGFKAGDKIIIDGFYSRGIHNENGDCFEFSQINDFSEAITLSFKKSNRYKLHKYILSTGFTKQYLSLALNKNQSYLATETRASQFYNRGDMSDARCKSLRKQIKEAVQIKSDPTYVSLVTSEITQTLAEVEPQDKKPKAVKVKDLKITIDGKELVPSLYSPFDCSPNESVSIEVTEKPSNNGAFILGLVFFVMLIIFGIGCLIYKAA